MVSYSSTYFIPKRR